MGGPSTAHIWLRTWATSTFMMEIGLTTQKISLPEDLFDSYRLLHATRSVGGEEGLTNTTQTKNMKTNPLNTWVR
jgi:hypothetical protein